MCRIQSKHLFLNVSFVYIYMLLVTIISTSCTFHRHMLKLSQYPFLHLIHRGGHSYLVLINLIPYLITHNMSIQHLNALISYHLHFLKCDHFFFIEVHLKSVKIKPH